MTKRLFIVSILLFWSCEEIVVQQDNPLDLGNPEYEEPQILGFTINGVKKILINESSFNLDESSNRSINTSKNNLKSKLKKISNLVKEIKKLG